MNDNDKENEATTGKCAECGGETPARDTHQCAACHVTLCESCVETCHDCGVGLCHGCYEECQCAETLCHDCALPCSACGRMLLCSDCAVRCDVCDDPLCSDCEYRCEDCDCALCYECVYDLADDYVYCSDCWNSRRQEPYYADSPCWLKMQEHKHMLTIGLEIEINGAHGQSRLLQRGEHIHAEHVRSGVEAIIHDALVDRSAPIRPVALQRVVGHGLALAHDVGDVERAVLRGRRPPPGGERLQRVERPVRNRTGRRQRLVIGHEARRPRRHARVRRLVATQPLQIHAVRQARIRVVAHQPVRDMRAVQLIRRGIARAP